MNELDKKIKTMFQEVTEKITPPVSLKAKIDWDISRRESNLRKKITVLFGGCSPEYSVSLQSAYSVICHINQNRYEPVLIGITKKGDWFLYEGDVEKIPTDTWCNSTDCTPVILSPNRTDQALIVIKDSRAEKIPIDAAFPVLHGQNGEDGTVQGAFGLAGIPVVGCGTLSSALCMDKDRAHKLAKAAGITIPSSFVLEKHMPIETALRLADQIGYPLFVKPVKAGSSFGITKIKKAEELAAALELAFEYDQQAIVEECISGFEVGCAILGSETLTIGDIDEIELSGGFFNYTEKYTLKTSAIHVPARIPQDTVDQIKQVATTIYRALDCKGFARVDLFLTPSGEIIFNEVNTIPGFTTHSRYPNMMKSAGISFEQIISAVIEQAVNQ